MTYDIYMQSVVWYGTAISHERHIHTKPTKYIINIFVEYSSFDRRKELMGNEAFGLIKLEQQNYYRLCCAEVLSKWTEYY